MSLVLTLRRLSVLTPRMQKCKVVCKQDVAWLQPEGQAVLFGREVEEVERLGLGLRHDRDMRAQSKVVGA